MLDAKLQQLDEPSIGLAPAVIQTIGQIIQTISRSGVDVLLVEQNADMALKLSDDGYVLENGTIVMKGNAHDLARSDAVREAYIGLSGKAGSTPIRLHCPLAHRRTIPRSCPSSA